MRNHWDCSKFADWLRGTKKPDSASAEGWTTWEKMAKLAFPVRYWIAEEGLKYVQDFIYYIPDKIHDAKSYCKNRWIDRTHSLTANPVDVRPGSWCDIGNRFLPCLFNELVDFVEVEKAWMQIVTCEDKSKYKKPKFRFLKSWRNIDAGIDYLKWETSLIFDENWCVYPGDADYGKRTPQSITAQEILDLYNWWTIIYRNRPDPYEITGWSAYCDEKRKNADKDDAFGGIMNKEKSPEERKRSQEILDVLRKLEEAYRIEDEEMMIRLIKIRDSLWT